MARWTRLKSSPEKMYFSPTTRSSKRNYQESHYWSFGQMQTSFMKAGMWLGSVQGDCWTHFYRTLWSRWKLWTENTKEVPRRDLPEGHTDTYRIFSGSSFGACERQRASIEYVCFGRTSGPPNTIRKTSFTPRVRKQRERISTPDRKVFYHSRRRRNSGHLRPIHGWHDDGVSERWENIFFRI